MTLDSLQIDSAAISDIGLSEKRPQNEDSYIELRDSGLYAVADGVGGAQAGDVASQMAVEILGEGFIHLQEDGDAEERMKVAIEQANGAIFQMANDLKQLSTMATTIVAIHINGNIATIGHVGDSRLYRLDEKGDLFRETQDHSVVEEEVRAGRMTPEQALTHPSRNVISRALGAEYNVEIDMKTIMFEPNTKFLVCSDGVTRHIPDEELKSILIGENDNDVICGTIKSLCYERGALDNLTAVVVSISQPFDDAFIEIPEVNEDLEEDTVTTSRPPLVNSAVFGNSSGEVEQFTTQDLAIPQGTESEEVFEAEDISIDEEINIPLNESKIDNNRISIDTQDKEEESKSNRVTEKDIKSYRVDDKGGIGIIGTIISGLLWLVVGTVIGALAYHFWISSSVAEKTPPQPQIVGETISVAEKNKHLAVTDPATFVENNTSPKDAYDNYLLGLAFIGVGNFDSAKKQLKEAESLLNALPAQEKDPVLQNDIALAMSKVNGGDNKKEAQKPMEEKANENSESLLSEGEPGERETAPSGESEAEDTAGKDN